MGPVTRLVTGLERFLSGFCSVVCKTPPHRDRKEKGVLNTLCRGRKGGKSLILGSLLVVAAGTGNPQRQLQRRQGPQWECSQLEDACIFASLFLVERNIHHNPSYPIITFNSYQLVAHFLQLSRLFSTDHFTQKYFKTNLQNMSPLFTNYMLCFNKEEKAFSKAI